MNDKKWLTEISPKKNLIDFNFKEIWAYKDLLLLFVKRDVITKYKQTILGPLWYLIQPLFTSIIFTLVFANIAEMSTDNLPAFLFYLAGITCWNYFKDCLVETSDTFKKNEAIFGKVYFPRVIMPMSVVVSNLLKFGIQLFIFMIFYCYYYFTGKVGLNLHFKLMYLPLVVISMGTLGLGLGMIVSSMVTKYRDLTFLVAFGVQLLMYLSAVIYTVEELKEKLVEHPVIISLIEYNPLTTIVKSFRNIVFSNGTIEIGEIGYMLVISLSLFLIGLLVFNKTEKSFIDTI